MYPTTLSSILSSQVTTLSPDLSVSYALQIMAQDQLSSIIIVDEQNIPIGIFTEHDMLKVLSGDISSTSSLSEVMGVDLCKGNLHDEIHDAYIVMSSKGYRHLIVVDDENKLAGVVTQGDFLRNIGFDNLLYSQNVKDVMSKVFVIIKENDTLIHAAQSMTKGKSNYAVVMRETHPIGVITERDILHSSSVEEDTLGQTAAHFCKPDFPKIYLSTSLVEAARLMEAHSVHQLIVMDDYNESLIAVVTRYELLKAIHGNYFEFLLNQIENKNTTLLEFEKNYNLLLQDKEELAQSEKKFKVLFEMFPEGITLVDLETHQIVEFNHIAAEQRGYTDEEFKQIQISDFEALKTPQEINDRMAKILQEGHSEFSTVHRRKDGSLFDVFVSVSAIKIREKSFLLAYYTDITEKKRRENRLDSQLALLKTLASDMPMEKHLDAIALFVEDQSPGAKCSILMVDDTTQKLHIGSAKHLPASYNALVDNVPLGYGEGSCGTACYTALPVYVSDTRTDPLWAKYREVFSPYTWLRSCWSTPFFDIQKKVLGSFAIYGDTCRQPSLDEKELMSFAASLAGIIVERFKNQDGYAKQATFFQTLVNTIPDMIWIKDINGVYLGCNPTFERFFGAKAEDIIGKTDYDFVNSELADFFRFNDNVAMRAKAPSMNEEWITFADDGHRALNETIKVPMLDKSGEAMGILGISHDITARKNIEDTLLESERFLNASQSIAQIGSYILYMGTMEFTTSATMDQIFGIDANYKRTFEGWSDLIHPDDRLRMNEYFTNEVATKLQTFDNEYRIICPNTKQIKWVHGLGKLEFDENGKFVRLLGTIQDITKSKQMLASLQKLSLAVEQSPNAIVITDIDGNIEYVNNEFTRNTGYNFEEVIGENPRILQSHQTVCSTYDDMWEHLTKGEIWKGELINQRKDKSVYIESAIIAPVKDKDGKVTNYIAIKEDITEKKRAEKHIDNLAHFDQLTGLANRTLLNDRVNYLLSTAKRTQKHFAVMFLDLDHFKNINDTLGHTLGDKVLIETAKRIKGLIRVEDTVARLGGDEFILIFPETDSNAAIHVATKLIEEISEPSFIELHELTITPSIGIAIYPDDGEDFDTLLKNADTAMYKVKNDSRNNFHFFTQEMQKNSARNLELSNALRHALKRGELELYYQPQIAIEDGRVIGAEALLRWNHPTLGMVSPAEFIPIAEDSGQIIEIGTWVLRTALLEMKRWIESGFDSLIVAVNISSIQFKQPNFSELIIDAFAEIQVPHECLEVELTEAVAMHNPKTVIGVMNKLHDLGIRMSIDDFGTGYSSLSYLKQFKVYKLKIDQSFIHDIVIDGDDRSIVSAIIDMANNLGLQTIAEGVETAEQLAFLRLHGCNEIQGYYFSKPLKANDFMKFIVNNKHSS